MPFESSSGGWISEDYSNVLEKKPIQKLISDITKARADNHQIITLPQESWFALMGKSYKIKDVRKVRYLLCLLTGMRDHETEGLIWSDLHLSEEVPFLSVERQLDKIGRGMVRYEDLIKAGMSKDQIAKQNKAIVSNPKYNSKRIIPLHPLLVRTLVWWRDYGWRGHTGENRREDSPVFARALWGTRGDERPGDFCLADSAALLRKDLERVGKGDSSITFHSLRRTFATALADCGVEEYKIGNLLGHKNGKSVTSNNYIAKNLGSFAELIQLLPVPDCIELSNTTIRL